MTEPPPLFILANDDVVVRLIMLAASLRHFDFPNQVYIVPYSEKMRLTRGIAALLGYEIWDREIEAVNMFARDLYDRDPPTNQYPKCLGNLHKMAFLSYPKKAVYLDADIVLTTAPETFNEVFAALEPDAGKMRIGYINTSPTGVYEQNEDAAPFLAKSHLFCAGMLTKSEGTISIDDIRSHFTESQIALYHRIRRRGGHVDQPVWNFLADTQFLQAVDLLADEQASRVTSPNQEGLTFTETGLVSIAGRPVLLFHMAGPLLKTAEGSKFFWQGMLWEGLQTLRELGLPDWREVFNLAHRLRPQRTTGGAS